jgi:hypothetical protein
LIYFGKVVHRFTFNADWRKVAKAWGDEGYLGEKEIPDKL